MNTKMLASTTDVLFLGMLSGGADPQKQAALDKVKQIEQTERMEQANLAKLNRRASGTSSPPYLDFQRW